MCTKTVFFYIYHMANIAIFASGNGTNAENIIRNFADNNIIKIAAVFSNKEKAPVLEKAKNLQVPAFYFKREDFSNGYPILEILHKLHIDGICLAGFLCMVSPVLLKAFPKRIINIHPSLLPKFGGKGMYGLNVHRKVIENSSIDENHAVFSHRFEKTRHRHAGSHGKWKAAFIHDDFTACD